MRKIWSILMILMLLPAIAAAPFHAEGGAGVRYDMVSCSPFVYTLGIGYCGFTLGYQHQWDSSFDLSLGYDLRAGKTMHNLFMIHTDYVPREGGWTDFSYVFSQRFLWDFLSLGYGVGLQGAVGYSEYGTKPFWSAYFLLSVDLSLVFEHYVLTGYLSMYHPNEREWKPVPVAGIRMEGRMTENHSIFIDAYARVTEILIDPVITVDALSIRAGYIYRGGI